MVMSHAQGLLRFENGQIGHLIYHGTSDIMLPMYYDTPEVAWEEYQKRGGRYPEECTHKKDKVEVYSDYGGGFYWEGTACRKCKAIDYKYTTPYGDEVTGKRDFEYINGKPEWVKELFEE